MAGRRSPSCPVVRIVYLIHAAPSFLSFDTVLLCSLVASVLSFCIDSRKMKVHQPLKKKKTSKISVKSWNCFYGSGLLNISQLRFSKVSVDTLEPMLLVVQHPAPYGWCDRSPHHPKERGKRHQNESEFVKLIRCASMHQPIKGKSTNPEAHGRVSY